MFVDARELPSGHEVQCDICIVGAGAAGITLAREFRKYSKRVCVLESGGLEYDSLTQSLYHGQSVGFPYFSLVSTRLRFFGGTTNHWGGNCYPFSDVTFRRRPWFPGSGWPFDRQTMDPFYDRAAQVIDLPSRPWDHRFWIDRAREEVFEFGDQEFNTYASQKSPVRLGLKYRDELSKEQNVTIYLNANLRELVAEPNGQSVQRARVVCLTGTHLDVRARHFILAAGGIENARLLLLSTGLDQAGLGNQHDLVGRYFMDQPRFVAGWIAPRDNHLSIWPHGENSTVANSVFSVQLQLSPKAQEKFRIGVGNVSLLPVAGARYAAAKRSMGVRSLWRIYRDLVRYKWPDDIGYHISNMIGDLDEIGHYSYMNIRHKTEPLQRIDCSIRFEPVPNRESRVYLGAELDALGQRRVVLDWRFSELDKETVRRTVEALGVVVGRAGFGRVKSLVSEPDWDWPAAMRGGHHHIGTTRMNVDPRLGVVDENCKVHGLDNLYVAGSSVFPTAGLGWPTYTLIALAIRLADHIKGSKT